VRGAAARGQACWKRGVSLRKAGKLAAARESFAEAARCAPTEVLYWINLARCEQQLGQADAALEHATRAFDLDTGSLIACNLLAKVMHDAHRPSEVLQVLDRLDAGVERDALWHLQRGAALLDEYHSGLATQSLLSALALAGADLALRRRTLTLLGQAFGLQKMHFDGSLCYRMVLDMDPMALGHALAAAHFGTYACDWAQFEQDMARLDACIAAIRASAMSADLEAFTPFSALNLSDDPRLMRWLAERAWGGRSAKHGETGARPARAVPRPGGKLRIGWLSADLHHHATAFLVTEVLEAIDRERFELYFYSSGPDDHSATRRRVMATATQAHEVAQWSDAQLVAQIRRDEIGVLIDLKGFTLGSRLSAMVDHPAPIQVAWLGFPGTCGAGFVDYIIGDPAVTPLEAQPHYSECIAQMPHCYQPNDSQRTRPERVSRAECGLPQDAFVFGGFNQSYKILPPVFEAWCRIVAAKANSVLWLLVPAADTQARLRKAAAGHGIAPDRLIFAPFAEIESHRARLPNTDLFLDTFPCGGHTTASDALWAGVPVLTMIGETFASRVAASLVTALGLPELVCSDLDQYITKALCYANDPAAMASLRERVEAGRRHSPLFDGKRFARDFGQLLLRMVERQDAGLPPAPLPALATEENP